MKIAKYTLYVEIQEDEITTEELQTQIENKVLSQCALNGQCLLVEEKSRIVDESGMSDEEIDNRPLNYIDNSTQPEIWEQTLNAKFGWR